MKFINVLNNPNVIPWCTQFMYAWHQYILSGIDIELQQIYK